MNTQQIWDRWGKYVLDGWYGFDINFDKDEELGDHVHKALLQIERHDPEFELLQCKLKFGPQDLRLYINTCSQEAADIAHNIHNGL